jgi:hypothetical protein
MSTIEAYFEYTWPDSQDTLEVGNIGNGLFIEMEVEARNMENDRWVRRDGANRSVTPADLRAIAAGMIQVADHIEPPTTQILAERMRALSDALRAREGSR